MFAFCLCVSAMREAHMFQAKANVSQAMISIGRRIGILYLAKPIGVLTKAVYATKSAPRSNSRLLEYPVKKRKKELKNRIKRNIKISFPKAVNSKTGSSHEVAVFIFARA